MRNITTGEKGAMPAGRLAKAGGNSGGHEGITVLRKARHPLAIHDVVHTVIHNGYTILEMYVCVKGKGEAFAARKIAQQRHGCLIAEEAYVF